MGLLTIFSLVLYRCRLCSTPGNYNLAAKVVLYRTERQKQVAKAEVAALKKLSGTGLGPDFKALHIDRQAGLAIIIME